MAIRSTRTLVLGLSVLLLSTSLANAGFIWLAPDGQNSSQNQGFSRQSESSHGAHADTDGREWSVEGSVPSVSSKTVASPTFGALPQSSFSDAQAAVATMPVTAAAQQSAQSQPQAILSSGFYAPPQDEGYQPSAEMPPMAGGYPAPITAVPTPGAQVMLSAQTMTSEPVYSKGDQKATSSQAAASAVTLPVAAPITMSPVTASPVVTSSVPPSNGVQQSSSLPTQQIGWNTSDEEAAVAQPAYTPAPPVGTQQSAEAVTLSQALAQNEPKTTMPAAESVSSPRRPVSLITGNVYGDEASSASVSSPAIPVVAPALSVAPANDTVVQGFGKHVPLVIALRQILPSSYTFAHGDGVNLSQPVDWQGGKPWSQVLQTTLASISLQAVISADTVMIEPAQAGSGASVLSSVALPATIQNSLGASPMAVNALAPAVQLSNSSMVQSLPSEN